MALNALDDLAAVRERYVEARRDLDTTLEPDLVSEILRARETIAGAVARWDGASSENSMT
jgi:hypothetical protein